MNLLPTIARVYARDSRDLDNTRAVETRAFSRFGVLSPVYDHWARLRDAVQRLLGDTAVALERAGRAREGDGGGGDGAST